MAALPSSLFCVFFRGGIFRISRLKFPYPHIFSRVTVYSYYNLPPISLSHAQFCLNVFIFDSLFDFIFLILHGKECRSFFL